MIYKKLTCSVKGFVVGIVEFDGYNSDDVEKAIKAVESAKENLGLHVESLLKTPDGYCDRLYKFTMKKTDTPEHFRCLAEKARCDGWE